MANCFKEDPGNIYGTDLRPTYRLKNDDIIVTTTEVKVNHSPEEVKKWAAREKESIIKREKNFAEGVNFYENFERVDIETITDTPIGWNLFEVKEADVAELMRSIDAIGLLDPIYVTREPDGTHTVICGRLRLLAFISLYELNFEERYKFIPAYVINSTEVDELFLRSMIIESNIKFRSISKFNMIQSLIQNYEIMKLVKNYRNESNLAAELSKVFDMSESSIFNFLRVKKLCDPGLTLLYEGRITLKSALYLTKVSKETQINILERFGVKGVNTIYKLKLITKEGNISLEELDAKIKELENYSPPKTKITIEVDKRFIGSLLEYILNFKKDKINPFANDYTRGNTSSLFKFKYDEDAMEIYAKQNLIDEKTLRKLASNLSYEKIA
ncbi:MAG: ParB N-terminal domain-containing protein [Oscillospiraceae bacterium]|nr:ParB N-terminal domain-containing protein [Oscillospiraceae bacterium]